MDTERNGPGAEPPGAAPERLARLSRLPMIQLRWPWRSYAALAAFWVATCGTLSASGSPRWRIAGVAACWIVQAVVTLRFALRGAAPTELGAYPPGALRLGVVHLAATTVALAFTGGLLSPLFVTLLMPPVTSLALFGAVRECRILVGVTASCLVVLGLLPRAWSGPPPPGAAGQALGVMSLVVSLLVVGTNVLRVRSAIRESARDLARVRDELASRALARARDLEEASAHVAHELKNPLAAVKALAQLGGAGGLAGEARGAFAAIDREVARMQGTLGAYLTFARPLDELRPAAAAPRAPGVRLRMPWTSVAVAAGVQAIFACATWLGGLPLPRVAGVVAIGLVKLLPTERYAARPAPALEPGAYPPSALLLMLIHVVGGAGWMALTGGLGSPFLMVLFPPAIVSLALFDAVPQTRAVLVATLAAITLLAFLPGELAGPPLAGAAGEAIAAAAALGSMLIVGADLVRARELLSTSGRALARAREELASRAVSRAERLEEAGAKVARDLERPLAEVGSVAERAAGDAAEGRAREWLEVIRREVARMRGILAEYRSFSRPLQTFRPERVELGPLVAEVLAVLSGRAARAGVHEEFGGDASVTGDPRRLKEALLNLVANAIDATPSGGRVEVQVAREEGDARIVIRDTGRGMTPDVLDRVGTPFFTTREAGTGLGVVLARSVFHRHGGALRYESAPGLGTTVVATLPLGPDARRAHGERALG